jgi:tetratricopeptide (TPR) repeat protein
MTLHRKILTALAVTAAAITVCTARSNKSDWDSDAKLRKADYVFMRACGANALDSIDTGSRLLARAALLNPEDVNIAGEQALLTLTDNSPDSVSLRRAYNQLNALFNSNPTDYNTGCMVGQLAGYLLDFGNEVRVWKTLDSIFPAKTDPAVNLANAYVKRYITNSDTADFNRGIHIFERLERGTGKDKGLTSQKIRAYALRNDTAAIVREINSMLQAMPSDADAFLYAGSIYNNYGNDSAALANYKHACQIDSTNGRAFVSLANYYRQIGDSVAYDREVFQALQSQNLEFDAKYEIMRGYVSELYSDTTQWDRIENLFGVLQEENPGEAGVHLLYGAFKSTRDDSEAALEQFSYAMALDPSDSSIRMSVIQFATMCDSVDYMIDVAKKGIDLFPTNFYYPIMAASGYQQKKKYSDAVEVLESVNIDNVQNKKAVSNLLTTLGDNYYLEDSLEAAFSTYERAIKLDPENYMAYNNAGYFLAESSRDLDKAIRYTRYAVLSEPQNATYLDSYAWALFKNKEYEKARENIDLALKYSNYGIDSDSMDAVVDTIYPDAEYIPDADDDVEEDPEALAEFVNSVQFDDSSVSADILAHAGDIYFMCGEPDKALDFWKEALALKPDDDLLARKVKHKTYFYK